MPPSCLTRKARLGIGYQEPLSLSSGIVASQAGKRLCLRGKFKEMGIYEG
jgi:hypothetical protein